MSDTPIISWVISGQKIASNGSGITLTPTVTNDTISVSQLQFDPLTVVHEGDYTCQAMVGITNISYTYSVAVQSRSNYNSAVVHFEKTPTYRTIIGCDSNCQSIRSAASSFFISQSDM